jgi:hypothetical protein
MSVDGISTLTHPPSPLLSPKLGREQGELAAELPHRIEKPPSFSRDREKEGGWGMDEGRNLPHNPLPPSTPLPNNEKPLSQKGEGQG